MTAVYCYITSATDGSKVHIDSFMRAFTALGESLIDAGIVTPEFTGNKSEWTLARRVWAHLPWLKLNLTMFFHVLRKAWRARADVLIFRFMPNHQLFFPIFVLSSVYPVLLEINAVRAMDHPGRSSWVIALLDRLTLLKVRKCFVVSNAMRDYLLARFRLEPDRVAVVENGVDTDLFAPTRPCRQLRKNLGLDGRFVIGFVGSFKPWHGIHTLSEVAERLVARCPSVAFLIVGDGKERSNFEAVLEKKGLSGLFFFTGFVQHVRIREYLALMDVVLAPYPKEWYETAGGFFFSPLKIFEYMAMAKAIIAPPLGQISELIADGESGRLIYSEDVTAIVQEIARMHADEDYRCTLGANARRRAESRYTWKANAEKVRALCAQLLKTSA